MHLSYFSLEVIRLPLAGKPGEFVLFQTIVVFYNLEKNHLR